MIKCEVIKEFTLEKFNELKNIQRRRIDTYGKLYEGDTFECTKEMADYLMGNNKDRQVVVKVIEVEPEISPIIGHKADDVEYVVPLNNENIKKISKAIEKSINENGLTIEGLGIKKEIKTKKKKSSKK